MNTMVEIDYTNWRGVRRKRVVRPTGRLVHGTTEHHLGEPQWFMLAVDVGDTVIKSFAMKDIHSWVARPAGEDR